MGVKIIQSWFNIKLFVSDVFGIAFCLMLSI